jgi:hypothetical protein
MEVDQMNTQQSDCGCGCGGDCQGYLAQLTPVEQQACCAETKTAVSESTARPLMIEFMYLDLSTCTRCQGTEASLEAAVEQVSTLLKQTGSKVTLRKIHVQSEEQAHQLNFVSSPTIRVNGRDIQLEVVESGCDDCGELCGTAVNCRVWRYQGQTYEVPPAGLIIDAVLRAVYAEPVAAAQIGQPTDAVPANLKTFFAGQPVQAACCQ